MSRHLWAGLCLATMILVGCDQQSAEAPPADAQQSEQAYSPVPIGAEDQPGTPRQVRCQIGASPEQDCTLTPLFGDESFQLDGVNVALRMVVTENEGALFEVMGPEHRVPIGGLYRRASTSDPCWTSGEVPEHLSPICVR